MANAWFYFISGSTGDPNSYDKVSGGSPNCPLPDERLCAIFAEIQLIQGIQRPIITPTLQTQISDALNNKQESANVLLKPD